ncbi:MAG: hypothetical protein B6I29_00065 [Marinitoga sp. 4572_148]|nr:MAG: hypothetical protein B6I29_00065 [Marinitoga sp. 4572_148]
MKRTFIILLLLLFSLIIFGERFYLINGDIIEGKIIQFEKGSFFVQKGKVIEIPENNIIEIEFLKNKYDYAFNMPKDYKKWRLGGRQKNGSLIYEDIVDEQKWLRIHKDGYTENNLYMDFELPFYNNTNIEFSSEIMSFTSKALNLSEKKYAIAGIIFKFLDEDKNEITRTAYAWGTNAYPFEKHPWINRLYASMYKPFEISFAVNDFVKNKEAKYLRVIFWTYCSSNENELSADLWVKNVKLNISVIQKK